MQTISSLSSAKLVPGEEVTLVSLVQAIDRDNNLQETRYGAWIVIVGLFEDKYWYVT